MHDDDIRDSEEFNLLYPELPPEMRVHAIRNFLYRTGNKPQIPKTSTIPTFTPVQTSIRDFNAVFPLGEIFKRWKYGIPIFPKCNHSVGRIRNDSDPFRTAVIEQLLIGKVISKANHSAFISNFFVITKNSGSLRPIMDYSHLTKKLSSPHFVLPSLFQVIKNNIFKNNLFFVKIDLKNAFFNIPLKQSSRYVTTFKYNYQYYQMNKLPMGLSIAPFVMQRFSNAIVDTIRPLVDFAWAHIDDILIASQSPTILKQVAETLVRKLSSINWQVNFQKSTLIPSRGIEYLGGIWSSSGVRRNKSITQQILDMWNYVMFRKLEDKPLQRMRGLLIYYLGYAGLFHAVINRILISRDKWRYNDIIMHLLKQDHISFNTKHKPEIIAYSDASLYQIAAIVGSKTVIQPSIQRSIMINELKAAILALKTFKFYYNIKQFSINLSIDNLNVFYFIKKGSCKWTNLSIRPLFHYLNFINKFHINLNYIPSELNPADAPSRCKL